MAVKRDVRKKLHRLLCSRRGTAEIIGSVMFLLIMMFFFTNVFLWHDRATREMDGVLSEKMNSPVSIQVVSMDVTTKDLLLNVTNNGGVGVVLSRLWIVADLGEGQEIHNYKDLTTDNWIAAGDTIPLPLDLGDVEDFVGKEVTFTVVTTRGNMAACIGVPVQTLP